MPSPKYAHDDSRLEALRQEMRADVADLKAYLELRFGQIEGRFGQFEGRFGDLKAELAQLRGEFKVWIIVVVLLLTPFTNLLATRAAAILWPPVPTQDRR